MGNLESGQGADQNVEHGDGSKSAPRFRFRQKFLILPEFQYRLLFWNMICFVVVFVLILLQVWRATRQMRGMGEIAGFPSGHPYFIFLRQISANLYFYIAGSFILGGVVSLLITLVVSHRLSGPVYRLMKHFESIAGGEAPGEIRFRRNDYLENYAPMINRALDRLSGRGGFKDK